MSDLWPAELGTARAYTLDMNNAAKTTDHLAIACDLWTSGKETEALAFLEEEFAAGRITQYQLRVIEGVLGV